MLEWVNMHAVTPLASKFSLSISLLNSQTDVTSEKTRKPQCALEVQVLGVSCNSHRLS